jgi:hypothetical protein
MNLLIIQFSPLSCYLISLCCNWAPRHDGELGEWRYSSTHSLTSTLDRGEWSASRSGRCTPKERASGTHWIGGWVGPRAVLDAVVKRKIPSPRRKSNPRNPIVQPVAQCYTTELPRLRPNMRVYPKISVLATWSEKCKWHSSLPLGTVASLFCESA